MKTRRKKVGCFKCPSSPTNGFEPPLAMELWNLTKELKESHNCLAYAMNLVDSKMVKKCKDTVNCDVGFPQPGYASGHKQISGKKGCIDMVSRIWGDNPNVKATNFISKCPFGTSKIALIVDPNRDYHFLREDPDGYWSHKPGAMKVTRLDASNRPILRPDRALFMYRRNKDPLLYSKFCGYYCVPRNVSLHMMSEVRQGGAFPVSEGPILHRQTRRKSRD